MATERPVGGFAGTCLYWPIRASFLKYVAGLRDGRASVSDGAALTHSDPQEAVYAFDATSSADGVLAFRGDVRLAGHGGLLFVRIAHPWIVFGAGRADVTVDDPLVEDGSAHRIRLVSVQMARQGDTWFGTDVRLAPEGTGLFGDMYPANEPFDDLRVGPEIPGLPP